MVVPPPPVSFLDRRAPPPGRAAPPAQVNELPGLDDFQRLLERLALRCRRENQVLSALLLQVHPDPDADAALVLQLLAECARRLRSRVRSSDDVACWQGTQFGVLLPRCDALNAPAVLARLTRFAGGPYRLGERLLHLRLSGQVLVPGAR